MGRIVTIDLEKVLASGNDLKAKSPSGLTTHADLLGLASNVSNDPVSYLSSVGVELDAQTASMLRNKLASRSGGVQAGSIHIDIL